MPAIDYGELLDIEQAAAMIADAIRRALKGKDVLEHPETFHVYLEIPNEEGGRRAIDLSLKWGDDDVTAFCPFTNDPKSMTMVLFGRGDRPLFCQRVQLVYLRVLQSLQGIMSSAENGKGTLHQPEGDTVSRWKMEFMLGDTSEASA